MLSQEQVEKITSGLKKELEQQKAKILQEQDRAKKRETERNYIQAQLDASITRQLGEGLDADVKEALEAQLKQYVASNLESKIQFEEELLEKQLNKEAKADLIKAQVELYIKSKSAERRWDLGVFLFCCCVTMFFLVPPLNILLRGTYQNALKVGTTVQTVAEVSTNTISNTIEFIAPDLKKEPKKGDKVAGFTVTSGFGKRDTGIPGASTYHRGIDVGTPVGTPLYMIGEGQKKIPVECFEDSGGGGKVAKYSTEVDGKKYTFQLLHLSKCDSKETAVGSVVALSGDTGIGSGAHLHFEWINENGEKVPPEMWMLWFTLTGKMPEPILAR